MLQYDLLNYTQVKYELNKQEQQTPQHSIKVTVNAGYFRCNLNYKMLRIVIISVISACLTYFSRLWNKAHAPSII